MAWSHTSPPNRLVAIDALRGVALVWMTLFHFCFDLNYFGWWPQNFSSDPVWTVQRTAIVSLFLFCAGLGQATAHDRQLGWRRFWGRWLQIAACAAIVTAGSWFLFPYSFIYFGVLHGMAVMLVIARLSVGLGLWLWPLGLLALAMPWAAVELLTNDLAVWAPALDARWLNWLGLVSKKPFTEDYVPLFPWLGVLWWGVAAGQWLLRNQREVLAASMPRAVSPLVLLGRSSLSYYMVHQPVLLGMMSVIAWALAQRP